MTKALALLFRLKQLGHDLSNASAAFKKALDVRRTFIVAHQSTAQEIQADSERRRGVLKTTNSGQSDARTARTCRRLG